MQNLNVKHQINAAKEMATQMFDQAKSDAKEQAKRFQTEAVDQAKKIHEAVTEDFVTGKNHVLRFVFDRTIGMGETQLNRLKNLKSKLMS